MTTTKRFTTVLLAAVLLLAVAIYVWFSTDNFHPVIAGQIYRSAQPTASQLYSAVKRYGIKTVINLRGANANESWYQAIRGEAARLRLRVFDVRLRSRGLPEITPLLKLVEALQEAERPILVHCRDGADRSGLAGALALLLDGKHGLAEAREQSSIFYRVTYGDSVGKEFLQKYEEWLKLNEITHTPDHLVAWIRKDYVDSMGNLRFFLDHVNGFKNKRLNTTFRIDGDRFSSTGWAFDLRNAALLAGATLMLDNRPLRGTQYGLIRKDVPNIFGLPSVAASGWAVDADLTGWPRKCYGIRLRLVRREGAEWTSDPFARLCLE